MLASLSAAQSALQHVSVDTHSHTDGTAICHNTICNRLNLI